MTDDAISIISKDKEDFKRQVLEYAETDIPEGTHFFKISATLLKQLMSCECPTLK